MSEVVIRPQGGPTDLEVRVAGRRGRSLAGYQQFDRTSNATGPTTLRVAEPVRARYLLVWLTGLPAVDGQYVGSISEVTVRGAATDADAWPARLSRARPGADLGWVHRSADRATARRGGGQRDGSRGRTPCRATPRATPTCSRAHAAGDPDAFGEVVRRHRDRLWAVALRTLGDREEAADALQDGLVSAFRAGRTGSAAFRGRGRRHHLAAPDRRQRLPGPGAPGGGPARRPAARPRRARPR